MLLLTTALGAPAVQILGDDLQLLDHFAELQGKMPGRATYGNALKRRATTVVYAREGVDAAPFLAVLPSTATSATLDWATKADVVVALGDDLDQAAVPSGARDPKDPYLYGISPRFEGFDGPMLAVAQEGWGCCEVAPDQFTDVWLVDPAGKREGYRVAFRIEEDERRTPSFAGFAEKSQTHPTGRRPGLEARRARMSAVVEGPKGPRASVDIAVSAGRAVPDATGWTLVGGCDAGGLILTVTVTPAEGPARTTKHDVHHAYCYNQVGEMMHGSRLRPVWSAAGDAGMLVADVPHPFDHRQLGFFALP
ncbi:MAG: hypothetical protein H6734_02145 [Alphaproteobacteria bacterium]|nr:hypothetical protein [Alphaproteobacteria bacterium]